MKISYLILAASLLFSGNSYASDREYFLTIEKKEIKIDKITSHKITVNQSLPGPILEFNEGDFAIIHVENKMNEETSIHWHGIILPGNMDGVPGLNGFEAIKPGQKFTYKFKINQSGTYWYHAHSVGQEQDGLYGAMIIKPKIKEKIAFNQDYSILISDFHKENSKEILANLKKSSEYYQYQRQTIFDFFDDVKKYGFSKAFENRKMWSEMRMLPTDLSDVSGYNFLINGKTSDENWPFLFKKGEKIRLRFINGSAMSIYDVRIDGLDMKVISADGQNVEPIKVNEFRFAPGETYDVIVEPKGNKSYGIIAESIDRTGMAFASLTTNPKNKASKPQSRKAKLLTMKDMGMNHGDEESGWENSNSNPKFKILSYQDLKYPTSRKDNLKPSKDIEIKLGGNMERYIWTLNGKKYNEADPIKIKYNDIVRLTFSNETMMAHPIHLHGMFVALENGQKMSKLPDKHSFIVPPSGKISVILKASEEGEWAIHCHLLYHMLSGMMNSIIISKNGS